MAQHTQQSELPIQTSGSIYIKRLIDAITQKNPALIVQPLITFDQLASRGLQPFFNNRPDYIRKFWPKWPKLIKRKYGDHDAAAFVVLTAYVKHGGLFEVDLDCLCIDA